MSRADEDLLRDARDGDRQAWAELFDRHQRRIYRFVLQMRGSAAVADEVVQETFLDLLRGGLRFDASKGSLAAYLLGVARLKSRRLAGDVRWSPDGEALAAIAAPHADSAHQVAVQQRQDVLRSAVAALPDHYREPIVLCELNELSYEEAAAVMECPVGTVRSRLHRGKQMLADRLAPLWGKL
ncbi:MAG: sigma-70 family RNA polymerase sigma factor [Bryobacterales bacterium]|nr:sigma-70 family RNA polymerase sigma factor [Bryobacterales bacterium]